MLYCSVQPSHQNGHSSKKNRGRKYATNLSKGHGENPRNFKPSSPISVLINAKENTVMRVGWKESIPCAAVDDSQLLLLRNDMKSH